MKKLLLPATAGTLLLTSLVSHAATYSSDFSGLGPNDPLVPAANGIGPGYNGWTQSEPNPPDDPIQGPAPIAYGQAITGVGRGVAVGGLNATPTGDSFYVDHTVGIPFAFSSLSATFTMGRTNVDPTIQNRFEIGAYSAGSINLFSLVAEPSTDPDIWLIDYRSGAGSNIQLSTTQAFSINQITDMTASFTPSGLDINFALTLSAGGNTLNFSGTLPGLAAASFDSVRIAMDKVAGTNPTTNPFDAYGTNFIAVSGINAVPEPSSFLLLGLAGCAVLRRKRRA